MVKKNPLKISVLFNIFGNFNKLLINYFEAKTKSWHGCCLYPYVNFYFCFHYRFKKGYIMRQSLIHIAVLASLALPMASNAAEAAKEEKPSYTVGYNVGLFSQYIFRGLTQTDSKPALQGGIDFSHDTGFYLGAWGSNISWLQDDIGEKGSGEQYYKAGGSLELDFYGGYRTEIAKSGVTVDVGALQYYYPGTRNHDYAKANATELYGAIAWGWLQFKYSGVVSSDSWGFANSRGTSYTELNMTVPVGDYVPALKGLSVLAHAARQNFKGAGNDPWDYSDYKLGVTQAFDNGVNIGAYWTGTTARDGEWDFAGKNIGRSTGTVFLQKTF